MSNVNFEVSNPPPFDTLGLFTFLRTYARRHKETDPKSTVESWKETLERVINACNKQLKVNFTKQEEKEVFELLYNLKFSVAGRFLWQLGTNTVDKLGLPSLENCAFVVIDQPIKPFTWAMNLLMLGCVPPDTEVLSERGVVKIKDISLGDKVWSYNIKTKNKELKTVTALHNPIVGKDMNVKIKCHYGSLISSKKHPILVRRNGIWNYTLAGDVQVGDVLQKFVHEPTKEINFNNKSWFVGSFLGDGSSGLVSKYESRRVRLSKDNENVVRKFAEVLSELSNEDVRHKKVNKDIYNTDMWEVEKTLHRDNPLVLEWKNLVGTLESQKTYTIDIPDWIKMTSDKNVFMSFLAGLIDTDGTLTDNKVTISTVSKNLYESLTKYSTTFGLYCWTHIANSEKHNKAREKRNSGYKSSCDVYNITYRTRDFKNYINFLQNDDKRTRLYNDIHRERQKEYSRKKLIIPQDIVEDELNELKLEKTSWHFKKKLEKTGFIGSGYYESRNKSFDHLLQYDIVTDIQDNLDIDENWKDITVEDNNNYFCGEGSFYCSHNSGIGYRVLPEDIKDLPQVKYALNTRKDTGDADFIVPDSREGWIKLLGKVLKSHFYSGKSFTYSCINLRSKGAPIKSFGGLASGPDVLCDGMSKIDDIMNKRAGMQMRPIDLLDVMNVIGMIVVSGNVRRSAQICIGDCKDVEYLRAKRWDLGNIPNYRAYSNNSVVCNDINEVLNNNDFWEGYQGNGEPYGLINLKLSQSCGRLGETKYPDPDVAGFNPCLTGDTLIHTDQGLKKIEELVGKPFKAVVHGETYSSTDVGFWKSGNRDVFKITLENGLEVRATPNHKFAVSLGRGLYSWTEVRDMKIGDKLVLSNNREWFDWGCDSEIENRHDCVHKHRESDYMILENFKPELQVYLFSQGIFSTKKDGKLIITEKSYEMLSESIGCEPRKKKYKDEDFTSPIVSITPDGNEDVYDCTINDVHCFSANGILSHNCAEQSLNNYETCCLSEIYLPNITSKEELYKCASYAYRICKHSLTLPFHDSPETERIVHKNMRMGIGVTGYLQSTQEQKGWLSDCYNYLREYDNQYSIQHGFPKSIKITTCKPSGTLSILGNCTPGVHPGFAKFYKRRVRISSESPLIAIAKAHGYHVEYVQNFDGTYDHNTQIVTFPMRLPDHTIFAHDCSAVDQLEWVKKLQTDWSDNSVSVTVYYRKHELPAIKEWLKNNYNNGVKTVSFLLHSDHGFNQAPMEAITEEEYNRISSSCRPITDLNGVCYSNDDDEMMNNEKDCAGGACPRK